MTLQEFVIRSTPPEAARAAAAGMTASEMDRVYRQALGRNHREKL